MGDWTPLFLLVLGLYLAEGFAWAPCGTLLLVPPGTARRLSGGSPLARGGKGLLPVSFDPWTEAWICRPTPGTEASLDERRAGRRVTETRAALRPLRILCTALFVWTFGALPGWILLRVPVPAWAVLGAEGLLLAAVWASFLRAFRNLRPGEPWLRPLLFLVLSPADALRSADALRRTALAGFHPLAAAHALCPGDPHARLARSLLREAAHPLPGEAGESRTQLERALKRQALDPAALLAPPAPQPGCLAHCPRCEAQYTIADGTCRDCAGLALEAFPR